MLQPVQFSCGSVEVECVDFSAFQVETHVFHALGAGELPEEGRKVVGLHLVKTQVEIQRTQCFEAHQIEALLEGVVEAHLVAGKVEL